MREEAGALREQDLPEGALSEGALSEEESAEGRWEEDGSRGSGGPSRGGRRRGRRAVARQDDTPRDPHEAARALCLRQLTGMPRTRGQLAETMRREGVADEVAEEVLSRFEDVGLIDDRAFANAWVESRHHSRGLARRALARELRVRGVESALVDEAVEQLDPEQEEETARELVARKLASTRGLDQVKRIRRLVRTLARKGYGEGLALRIVRQALEEEGEDAEVLERYLPE